MLLTLLVVFISCVLIIAQVNCNFIEPDRTPIGITQLNCSFDDTYAIGSTFESNLLNLLSTLSKNAQFNSAFYNDSIGNSPNKVYGLIMCLVDSTLVDCINCLENAKSDATSQCPESATATVFYDSCMVSYSRANFISVADPYDPLFTIDGSTWIDQDYSNQTVQQVLANLSVIAPDAPEMFSFTNEAISHDMNISALVQCTKDLSPNECKKCITDTMPYVELYSSNYSFTGMKIMARNCYIRYDSDLFNVTSFPKSLLSPPPPTIDDPSGSGGSTEKYLIIVVPVVGVLVIACLAAFGFYFWNRQCSINDCTNDDDHDTTYVHANIETELQHILHPNVEYQVYDFNTLIIATENFSEKNRLGKGGFGPVYKGKFADGQEIAVKRLSGSSTQGKTEFKNEVEVLAKLKHKNLVKLLGCCIANEEKLLCYEYLPNGSLDKILFAKDASKRGILGWKMRHKIIEGITRGLHYLHEESHLKIIHRDLKVSNILLDKDMNPNISDFGLARFFYEDQTHKDTSIIVGTFGYMAPEYILHGNFSARSDVYSFGVLLLEIITGQQNSSFVGSTRISNLVKHALIHWKNDAISELKDTMLGEEFNEEIKRCVHIALLCVQESPTDRPTMVTVRNMLASQSMILPNLSSTSTLTLMTDHLFRDDSTTTDTSTVRSQADSLTTNTQSVGSHAESSGTKSARDEN